MAIRDHPLAASAMGINTALYKTLTFGVSALYTGVAGALGAIAVQFVAPDSFHFFVVRLTTGRARYRRRRLDSGKPGRRIVRAVRAEHRRERCRAGSPGAFYGVILFIGDLRHAVRRCRARAASPRRQTGIHPEAARYRLGRADNEEHHTPLDPRRGAERSWHFRRCCRCARKAVRPRRQPILRSRSVIPARTAAPPHPTARFLNRRPRITGWSTKRAEFNGRKVDFISYDDAHTARRRPSSRRASWSSRTTCC